MTPRIVRILRVIGATAMIAGGAAWGITFIRFATEHPGLDSMLWAWPFLAVGILGGGMLVAMLARWAAVSRGLARAGAALVATGAAAFSVILAIPAMVAFLAGSVVLGAGLSQSPQTRAPGLMIGIATGLFIVTRPWMLGAVQTGDALATQEVVEKLLAISLGVGWALLGITCLRGNMAKGAG